MNTAPSRQQLYEQGLSDVEIAEREGVTRQAIGQWRRKNGLTPHTVLGRYTDQIIKLAVEGYYSTQIAEIVGCTRGNVSAICHRRGINLADGRPVASTLAAKNLDKDRPPSSLPCKHCSCCVGTISWSDARPPRKACWMRKAVCPRCDHTRRHHGFSSHLEYDEYLGRGCYVRGCKAEATVIDHDHSVCPQASHSCVKCRRGPACASCNVILREDVSYINLRRIAEFEIARAKRKLMVAAHLEALEAA